MLANRKSAEETTLPSFGKIALGAAGGLALLGIVTFIWSRKPVEVDQSIDDPALVYLNDRETGAPQFEEGYFEHDGRNLHYVMAGEGETIVFLHGFPSFWLSFVRQLETFKSRYRVIAIDGLGAGRSDAPREIEPYQLQAMSEHILALLDAVEADRVHLVGHDWGSAFAIGLAQQHPERVISVTGISAPPLNASLYAFENDSAARKSAAYVENFKKANPAILVLLGTAGDIYKGAYRPLVEAGKLSPEEGGLFRGATNNARRTNAHINWYRANVPSPDSITDADFWPGHDARVTVPALYIWGEEDPIRNETAILRLLDLSDNAKLVSFPGVGHWPHVLEAESVNAAIREHIESASGDVTSVSVD